MAQEREKVLQRFAELGWFANQEFEVNQQTQLPMFRLTRPPSEEELNVTVFAFQMWHGLPLTGEIDSSVLMILNQPRFCPFPDIMPTAATQISRWKKNSITWVLEGQHPKLDLPSQMQAFNYGFNVWGNFGNIKASNTTNRNSADVVVTFGSIDGPMGTLAWSQLPPTGGQDMQLSQKYDTAENFSVIKPTPRGTTSMLATIAHEVGHVYGLPHGPAGNLMYSMLTPGIDSPQAWDIEQIKLRYPGVITPPPPPPGPPPILPPPGPTEKPTCTPEQISRIVELFGKLLGTGR